MNVRTETMPARPRRGSEARTTCLSAASSVDVQFIGLDGQSIPLEDDSCDAGLSTFTLCTIPDAGQALSVADRAYVLRLGQVAAAGPAADIAAGQDLKTLYLGAQ